MTTTASLRRSRGRRRPLVRLAVAAVVLGAVTVAILATGPGRGSLSVSLDAVSFAPLDISQLAGAFERGELPIEVLLIGTVIALLIGMALPLLAAALRRPRRSIAHSDAVPTKATEQQLGAPVPLEWPFDDAAPHLPLVDSSTGALDEAPGTTRLPHALLDAAEAERLAAREATAAAAGLGPELGQIRARDLWPPVATTEPWPVPDADALSEPGNGAAPAWRRDEPLQSTGLASIHPVEALHPAEARRAQPAIGTPEAPLVVELRGGPNLPLVAAIGTVAVGVAFSAGASIGATLGAGVGVAIGLAFASGAGAAIGTTVALLGGRRS